MIDINELRELTETAIAKKDQAKMEQDQKDKITAQNIFDKEVPKLMKKAAKKGSYSCYVYELTQGKDYFEYHPTYHRETALYGIGAHLTDLLNKTELKTSITNDGGYLQLTVSWK